VLKPLNTIVQFAHEKIGLGNPNSLTTAIAAAALITFAGSSAPAQAGIITDTLPNHNSFGANYLIGGSAVQTTGGGTVWARTTSPSGGLGYGGGIPLGSRYVLSIQSLTSTIFDFNSPTGMRPGGSLTIGTGSNFLTNQGSTFPVSRIIFFPDSRAGSPNFADYVIFDLGADVLTGVTPPTIRAAIPGEMTNAAGFGHVARVGETPMRTGNINGGVSPVRTGPLINGYNQNFYFQTDFNTSAGISLAWRTCISDGGAGNYAASDGALLGLASGVNFNSNDLTVSNWVNLSAPNVYNNIAPYRNVPSPYAAALLSLAGLVVISTRKREE